MDSLFTLTTYVINLTVFGAIVLFGFKFLQDRKNNFEKNQILNLNAKLSMLRMTLKGKIKTKSQKYRALVRTTITSGDPVDVQLNELVGLSLETGDEIEKYFDISKRMNSILMAEQAKENADGKKEQIIKGQTNAGQENFMGTDFKSEMAILRLIKELVDISAKLSKKIENYNSSNPKAPISKVSPLNFPSMTEVSRVFVNEDGGSSTSEAA